MAALREWRTKGRFADLVISKLLAKTKLTTSNRAFALEIFYGVLRNLTLIDSWIGYLRPSGLDLGLRDILRIGFYQLFFLKTPHYAAVYETVQLAPKRRRAVINGMLRTAIRQQDEMLTRAEAQPFLCERPIRNFWSHAGSGILALKPRKKSKSPNRAAGREAQLHLARSMES